MKKKIYKYKSYLYTNIIVEKHTKKGIVYESNPLTWEIAFTVCNLQGQYISFKKLENILNEIITPYQNQVLNHIKPFDEIEPNIKNFCALLKSKLDISLAKIKCIALSYEIAEKPTKVYVYDNIENKEYYKYRFYLDASHSVMFNNMNGPQHSHSFQINISAYSLNQDFEDFKTIETKIESVFDHYQDKFLNDMEEFKDINPTLENITEYFKEIIDEKDTDFGFILQSIEIADTPSISYVL